MKSYVITMKRHTQSIQAAKRCIASGKRFGLNIEYAWGITPDDDPLSIAQSLKIPLVQFEREGEKYSRYLNVLSAFLSHYHLWQDCADRDEPIRIFEHDAVIKQQMPDIPMFGKRCINLGEPSYGNFNTPQTIGINKLTSKKYFPGAHAYQLTPEAAKEIIEVAKTAAGPTDVFLHIDRFPWLEEYYPWPVVASDYFTTIQSRRGIAAKHSYWKMGESYEIL
jgi:GR25 family glycosyltransferase involved in LPS biosynthesis